MLSLRAPVSCYCSQRHGLKTVKPSAGPHSIHTKGTPASQFPLTHTCLPMQGPEEEAEGMFKETKRLEQRAQGCHILTSTWIYFTASHTDLLIWSRCSGPIIKRKISTQSNNTLL